LNPHARRVRKEKKMRIDRRVAVLSMAVVALVLALGGCGWFGGKTKEYETSREERPLEVPPDLDAPATGSALTIPDTRPPAAGTSASAPSTDVPPTPPPAVPSSYSAGEDSSLQVTDAPEGAWKRVGFALERSGVAAVLGRDETAGTYTVSGQREVAAPTDQGFFKKLFGGGKQDTTTEAVTRVVRIVGAGEGSLISIEDESGNATADEFSRRVIEALRQRLG
jgi:uncharacterized lipoprotein